MADTGRPMFMLGGYVNVIRGIKVETMCPLVCQVQLDPGDYGTSPNFPELSGVSCCHVKLGLETHPADSNACPVYKEEG